jgi:hypothetical protein
MASDRSTDLLVKMLHGVRPMGRIGASRIAFEVVEIV